MSVQQPPYNTSKSASKLSLAFIEAIYAALFAKLNAIYPISEALKHSIIKNSQVELFKKGEHLLEIGKVNRNINFIFKGFLWGYYINDKGVERISWFLIGGDIAISVVSFHEQIKSYEGMYVHEEVISISMPYDMLEWHYDNFLEFNVHGRKLKVPYHVKDNKRVYSSIMEDAKQRYNRLLKEIPDILDRVPSKIVASYLDVAPATLSKIKRGKY